MRKLKLYIAVSLNGKIAEADGSVEWLESMPNKENLDYGYSDFFNSIDSTIMGRSTYSQILSWGIPFPYHEKTNYVLTRNESLENTDFVEFVSSNHLDFVRDLKLKEGGDIWLIGGGQVNTLLLNAALIDEINVFVMPIVLSSGIEMFECLPKKSSLTLMDSIKYSTGVVGMRYNVEHF